MAGNAFEFLLKLSNGGFMGPLKQARDELGRFTARTRETGKASAHVDRLGEAFTGLAAKIGAAFTAYKAFEVGMSGLKKGLSLASAAETTATAFQTMLGSAQAAASVLGNIKKLAAETPFEFPELATAGRMLLAFGESAADIPETLRRIGDVSSAVAAPIGEIAEIYGKARTAGTLFAEDINQLTGRGIPIIREFARILKQPESAIKKLAEEGKLTFPLLDQAFRNLTSAGGQFFGMMDQQARTSAGLWSTLQDTVNELYLELGKPLNDAIKPVLNDAIGLAGQLVPVVQKMGEHVGGLVTATRNFVAEAQNGGDVVKVLGDKLTEALTEAGDALMIPLRALWSGVPALGSAFMAVIQPVGDWMMKSMMAAAQMFGAELLRSIASAMEALPFGESAAVSLKKQALGLGINGARSKAAADDVAAGAPDLMATARQGISDSMKAIKKEWELELKRFAAGLSAKEAKGLSFGSMPDLQGEGMRLPGDDNNAPGADAAIANATATKTDKDAEKKAVGQKLALQFESAELAILRAKVAGNEALADQMERELKTRRLTASYMQQQGLSEAEAQQRARERVALEEGLARAKRSTTMQDLRGGGGAGSAPGGRRKIMGYKYAPELDYGLGLSGRRAGNLAGGLGVSYRMTAPNVPSPGTARRAQERREAAATAARQAGGGHPLAASIKAMEAKLNTLAVAR